MALQLLPRLLTRTRRTLPNLSLKRLMPMERAQYFLVSGASSWRRLKLKLAPPLESCSPKEMMTDWSDGQRGQRAACAANVFQYLTASLRLMFVLSPGRHTA